MEQAREAAAPGPELAVRRLREAVERLAGFGPRSPRDDAAVRRTLQYLEEELTRAGYAVSTHRFGPGAGEVNLLAERAGTSAAPRVYELGAHYDTVAGSPGADDNASGVAGLLEAARVLGGRPSPHTIRFCLFGNEEIGALGSLAHVARIRRGELASNAALIFECIGFCARAPGSQRTPVRIPLLFSPPTTGHFVTAVADWRSRRLARSFARAVRRWAPELPCYTVSALGGLLRDAARSDHVPYWRAGRPGLMITDTANFRNPHYHRAGDLPETLDYQFMASVVRATVETLLALAA